MSAVAPINAVAGVVGLYPAASPLQQVSAVNPDNGKNRTDSTLNGAVQSPGAEQRQVEQEKLQKQLGVKVCKTCQARQYQDGSNDPGVSFKNATALSPDQAALAVPAHEQEHVVRERDKAEMEHREVVSQNVAIHMGVCPECGRIYVSGGTTETVTRSQQPTDLPQVSGLFVDQKI